MVQGHPQLVLFVVLAHQGHAQQRALAQVEGLLGLDLALRGQLGIAQPAEIALLEVEEHSALDVLQGLAVDFAEPGAQRFMAVHQCLERCLDGRDVQLAAQAQPGGNVVRRRVRLQLPEQPQAVLCQRLRQRLFTRVHGDLAGHGVTCGQPFGHGGSVGRQGWRFEQGPQAQVDAQLIGHTGAELGSGDGVAAQQQEVVVRGHGAELELIAPECGDARLQRVVVALGRRALRHCVGETGIAVETAVVHAQAAG